MTKDSAINLSKYKVTDDFPASLEMVLKGIGEERLVCTQLLRLLPGKRLVCTAEYLGEKVIAKIFFGPSYVRRWKREIQGVEQIIKSQVLTPEIIAMIHEEEQDFALVLFKYIEQSKTLDECWQEATSNDGKVAVLKQALSIIAKLHDAAVYQKDIHLDNFLKTSDKVYLIDGDQVAQEKNARALSTKFTIDNLAMFFTQIYAWQVIWIEELLEYYLSLRESPHSDVTLKAIKKKLKKHREWREKKYIEKKVFRSCTEFDVIKNWKTFCVFSRELKDENVKGFINAPDGFIKRGEILKSGRTATVAKIQLAGKTYVVKRYNKKNNVHRLFRSLKESRAALSWRNGHLLQFNGIPTALPILLLEQRYGRLRWGSYVITEYIEGMHLFSYLRSGFDLDEMKMMELNVKEIVERLHQSEFIHGDLKPQNIWITEKQPILIDLDGMKKVTNKYEQQVRIQEDWVRLQKGVVRKGIVSSILNDVVKK
ncbi:MAG: hypothetical protein COB22_00040 [Cycloclasticus sp.]|nr:MAG: hypothetical protein COB22_00040 [Cycloclasticus sp.]